MVGPIVVNCCSTLIDSKKCPLYCTIGQRTILRQRTNCSPTVSCAESSSDVVPIWGAFRSIFQHYHSQTYHFPTVITNCQKLITNLCYVDWILPNWNRRKHNKTTHKIKFYQTRYFFINNISIIYVSIVIYNSIEIIFNNAIPLISAKPSNLWVYYFQMALILSQFSVL